MASLNLKYDNRPDGDMIELPHVGVFKNGEKTDLSADQATALELHYGLKGAVNLPPSEAVAAKVNLNLTGEQAVVEETRKVDE